MANNMDTDQTASKGSSLIRVHSVHSKYIKIYGIIMKCVRLYKVIIYKRIQLSIWAPGLNNYRVITLHCNCEQRMPW